MSVHAMLRRAGAMTLLVYGVHALASGVLAAPLAADFARALAVNLYRAQLDAGDTALVLELGAQRVPALLSSSAAAAIGYTLLAPLLRMAWLQAMARGSGVRASLRHGVRKYPHALLVGGAALIAGGGLAAALIVGFAATTSALMLPIAGEQAARAACVLALGATWLLVSTLHDLAVAALASGTPLRGSIAVAARALSGRMLVAHAGIALAIAVAYAIAEAIGRSAASAGPSVVLALQQTLVFAAALLRGGWLAIALSRVTGSADRDADAQRLAQAEVLLRHAEQE
jgi:hypothetical protein